MKKYINFIPLFLLAGMLTSCEAVETIFKAGMWWGIILVVGIVEDAQRHACSFQDTCRLAGWLVHRDGMAGIGIDDALRVGSVVGGEDRHQLVDAREVIVETAVGQCHGRAG